MPRAYISARVEDELRIKQLRDQIWNLTEAHRFYRKKTPHITVIPPFTVKEGFEEEVEALLNDSPLKGRKVRIDTLGVYENIHKPYVVLLSADMEIDDVRTNLLNQLPQYTEGKIIKPVRPHITLFKTQGWWQSPTEDIKNTLQTEIQHRTSIKDTRVSKVEVEFKE